LRANDKKAKIKKIGKEHKKKIKHGKIANIEKGPCQII